MKKNKYSKKLGISCLSFLKLRKFKKNQYKETTVSFLGKPVSFSSPFWFLHSLDEIFVEEVYKFNTSPEKHLIIDCGANIGLSAIYLKNIFPNSEIIVIEPDKNVFTQLKQNLSSHNISNVTLINSAVWKHNDKLGFTPEGSVGGKISDSDNNLTNFVQAVRLKDLLVSKSVFFLKIDIEGAEYEVLKDCREELKNVQNLFIEFHIEKDKTNHLDEILNWVKEAGFSYYIKEAWDNMSYPFTREYNDWYHMQLNIFCFRKNEN